ncbi:hypothetical protein [Croceibacterium ferulae]|uniref:hypothetical protein n=1 Tax=Croceibacterium ferulae TaxID=1854641 RepID=UPI000F894041|nr:hypothetical protein [Croceibacterium ferulae]
MTAGRRSLMGHVAVLALLALPMPALAGADQALAPPPADGPPLRFDPPATPMLYTRRLQRELKDGKLFVVTRSFAIRFERAEGGFRVTGEQVAVEVDAPPQLDRFVQMERERVEDGLFPLQLTEAGQIVGLKKVAPAEQLDDAIAQVLATIAEVVKPAADAEQLGRFARAIHENALLLLTTLPPDLFAPERAQHQESRTLNLPDGSEGVVTASYRMARAPTTGLLTEAQREVITVVGGHHKRTVESWTLQPLP